MKYKTREEKIEFIKSLRGKVNDTDLRKKVGEVFKVGKTQRNEIFNQIFGGPQSFKTGLKEAKVGKTSPMFKQNGDLATAEVKGVDGIKTLEDLVEYCNIDLSIWEPIKFWSNVWADKLQVKAEFKRKVDPKIRDLIAEFKLDAVNYSPKVPRINYIPSKNAKILEIALPDLHLGKLSWKPNCGADYDSKIARDLFFLALVELVNKAERQGGFEKILFPIGNDYITIDSELGTTTAGTPQDTDSRFSKMFREGRKILVEAIDYLKTFAPVDVIVVPGNHDNTAMFHIGDSLECWYRNDENVSVNNDPISRKYYQYGVNLIGYCHGNNEKHDKLSGIMAVEQPQMWAQTKFREWHLGHLHHDWVREFMGCKVRILPSLTGNDRYHHDKGYVGNQRIGQAFLYDKENGLDCIFQSTPVE
jgi:hypothetical protein